METDISLHEPVSSFKAVLLAVDRVGNYAVISFLLFDDLHQSCVVNPFPIRL